MNAEDQALLQKLSDEVQALQAQIATRESANVSDKDSCPDSQVQAQAMQKLNEQVEALRIQIDSRELSSGADNNARIDASRAPKIPPIARKNLRNWLFQVEATLRRAGITQNSTKFDYLVCALDDDAMSKLSHIIQCDPLPLDAFEQAKETLISAYALSNEENLRKLLKGQIANTHCKPSLILSQIRELNTTCHLPEGVLKSIFLEQLSDHQREILTLLADKDLKTLADTADKLYAASNSSGHFAHTVAALRHDSTRQQDPPLSDAIRRLESKVDDLIEVLKRKNQSSTANNRNRSRNSSRGRNPLRLCLAHAKYPDNPTSCREWCSKFTEWSTTNTQGNS